MQSVVKISAFVCGSMLGVGNRGNFYDDVLESLYGA